MDWNKSDSDFRIAFRGVSRDLFIEEPLLYMDLLRRYLPWSAFLAWEGASTDAYFLHFNASISWFAAALGEDPIL
jgi:hypothetical protein